MKKIILLAMWWLCWTSVGRALEPQNLYLFNNSVSYQGWSENELTRDKYYFEIVREGKKYRTDRETLDLDLQDLTAWEIDGPVRLHVPTRNPAEVYFANQTTPIVLKYELTDEQLDFADLYFRVQMYRPQGVYPNRPVWRMSLCGESDVLVLERGNSAVTGVNAAGWQDILLPNPGTCEQNRELVIEILPRESHDLEQMIAFRGFALNHHHISGDEQISLKSKNGKEMALIKDFEVLAQGESLLVAASEFEISQNLEIGQVNENGQVENHRRLFDIELASWLYALHPSIQVTIQEIAKETDQSMSVRVATPRSSNKSIQALTDIEVATAADKQQLWQDWEELVKYQNDWLPNYQQIKYVSLVDMFQVLHLPGTKELDWQAGFYLAVRGKTAWGIYTNLSNTFFCQGETCQEVDNPSPKTVEICKLFFAQDESSQYVELCNQSEQGVDLAGWKFSEGQEEGEPLTGTIAMGGKRQLPFAQLSRSGGKLQLFNAENELIDQLDFSEVKAPLSLSKNLNTGTWKEIYERN